MTIRSLLAPAAAPTPAEGQAGRSGTVLPVRMQIIPSEGIAARIQAPGPLGRS
ncbi:hypothetical protein [Arthrobacter sp. NicSoilC5]|uniref:hypothetical protein n=1 Tax=Arthrobacter sp. NicSoilC5 TaxID=2831000 RepID=UPI001CC79EFD|nr:hypothetical protein [Arthrobacter sp. NicSoilC5]